MNAPHPYIQHTVCRQSGLHELWIMCGDKVLAGPASLPVGWVAIFNMAKFDADHSIAAALQTTGGGKP